MNSVITPFRKHLTDIHEWHKMGEANIFPPESRIELIEGEIFEMPPIGSNHASHLKRINKLFTRLDTRKFISQCSRPASTRRFVRTRARFHAIKAK